MPAITERSALSLAAAIRRRELTAVEVVEAHIELHRRWSPVLNAVVAERYEAAVADAAAADRRALEAWSAPDAQPGAGSGAADEGDQLPPLLGVPFTVKESIALAGMPHSAGLVARRSHRAGETAPSVNRLIAAGAIPLGVTNTSELTLWIESENRLYGRTSNPFDPARTAGGSSGGEGAAVGCGGSPFGLASDIAGSIRIPALFCGVFAHKPTAGTVPNTGSYPPTLGAAGGMLQSGPLVRRAQDLMPVLRLIAGPDGIDPLANEAPNLGEPETVALDGLTVVTIEDTSARALSHELRDARERAVGALMAMGARRRSVSLRSWQRALLPFLATLQAGSEGSSTSELISEAGGEVPSLRDLVRPGLPFMPATRLAIASEMLPDSPGPRARLVAAGRELSEELVETIGDGVLLHPAHPRPAPRHGRTFGRPWLLVPAAMFNLAGVPVTAVPLGLSDGGLPLGVQVAAGPGRDHVSIAVALALERVFGGWTPPAIPSTRRRRRGRRAGAAAT